MCKGEGSHRNAINLLKYVHLDIPNGNPLPCDEKEISPEMSLTCLREREKKNHS